MASRMVGYGQEQEGESMLWEAREVCNKYCINRYTLMFTPSSSFSQAGGSFNQGVSILLALPPSP